MFLKQIEYFVQVAELGSFTRAANVLDVGQPALSRQIRQLEVELRKTLFVRNGRGVQPTEAGQLLLEHGRGLLHQVERLREDLGRVDGALAGRVCVGLPPTIARLLTVPLVQAFRKELPHAVLAVSEGMTPSIIEGLRNGRLDVALLYNPSPSSEIDTRPLLEEPLVLVGRRMGDTPAEPLTLDEVSRLPLVMPGRLHTMRRLVDAEMAEISKKANVVCEVDGFPAILSLVQEGVGYTVMPARVIQEAPQPMTLVSRAIVAPELISRLTIATSARRPLTQTQLAVIGLLESVIGDVQPATRSAP